VRAATRRSGAIPDSGVERVAALSDLHRGERSETPVYGSSLSAASTAKRFDHRAMARTSRFVCVWRTAVQARASDFGKYVNQPERKRS